MTDNPDSTADYLKDRPVLTQGQARFLWFAAPLLIAACGAWIMGAVSIERLEDVTIDWRFRLRGPRKPPANIVIVELDEASRHSLKHDGRRFNAREHLAPAINNLADAGAVAIGLDILLEDAGDPAFDGPLVEAIGSTNVVLAAAHAGGMKRAAAAFLATDPKPSEGLITVEHDAGVLRRFPRRLSLDVLESDGAGGLLLEPIAHFPLVLAMYAIGESDESAQFVIEDRTARMGSYSVAPRELIDFSSTQSESDAGVLGWKTIRFEDAVRGSFDAASVDGSIVLVGEAGMLWDSHTMSLSAGPVAGVYYHANALAHILGRRRFDTRWAGGWRRAALTGTLAFVGGLMAWNPCRWWRHRRGTLLLLGNLLAGVVIFLGGWAWLTCVLFERNVLLPMIQPLIVTSIVLGFGLAAQWTISNANTRRLDRRARRIETLFAQSVSSKVLKALKERPEEIGRMQNREVSVLFCDIRDFTAHTSKMQPAEVADLLNEYFDYITQAAFDHDGFIDKFVGDEVMVVFSVPFEQADHPVRAVRTAIAIKRRLTAFNAARRARGQPALNCGIGIHSGPAAAGHIGSRQRSNYTVVGTTVNLAARIEHFTRQGEILVSDAVRRELPPEFLVRPWEEVEIRGSAGKHKLFEIKVDGEV
ncbi:MAG: adenylate/guanylate cyclase domain-containing protein [Planctomycetota bacterium]|nr:adenylate/guanylate cyclase domain-containing protein [Planctomycetota bacterium]